jgi:hypothetical protein
METAGTQEHEHCALALQLSATITIMPKFHENIRGFSPVGIARHAKRFDRAVFKERIMRVIDALVRAHQDNRPASFASRAVPVETVPDAAQV